MEATSPPRELCRHGRRRLSTVASVARFFISRVDTEVDRRLDAIGTPEALARGARPPLPRPSWPIASPHDVLRCPVGRPRGAGARVQRPLWASTSTKTTPNRHALRRRADRPGHRNTMPDATVEAFADHGRWRSGSTRRRSAEAVWQGLPMSVSTWMTSRAARARGRGHFERARRAAATLEAKAAELTGD